ncbi:hypothetical protein LNP20_28755 [Klebsiella pneumoniae subsp. pneumoniae]|nr:hypothetical protein [Klebsiella pneumoniae subsp. pneumoniae]
MGSFQLADSGYIPHPVNQGHDRFTYALLHHSSLTTSPSASGNSSAGAQRIDVHA